MKAITVRQPWAWAIIYGQKDVENRTRNIAGSYRGPLLIHVSLTVEPVGLDPRIAKAVGERSRAGDKLDRVPMLAGGPSGPEHTLVPWYGSRGGALGVVDLVDAHHSDTRAEEWDAVNERPAQCSAWAEPGPIWHLRLANPRPFLNPIPYRGRLGLWEFPDDLIQEADR